MHTDPCVGSQIIDERIFRPRLEGLDGVRGDDQGSFGGCDSVVAGVGDGIQMRNPEVPERCCEGTCEVGTGWNGLRNLLVVELLA